MKISWKNSENYWLDAQAGVSRSPSREVRGGEEEGFTGPISFTIDRVPTQKVWWSSVKPVKAGLDRKLPACYYFQQLFIDVESL